MIRLFDSHCHLTDGRFDEDRAAVFVRAAEAGVARVVTIASDDRDADAALDLARGMPGVWSTAGIHPHEAERYGAEPMERIEALLAEPEVVAVGETGLDYFYDNAPRERQRRSFEAHVELAAGTGLPVIVHTREAEEDTAAVLRSAPSDVVFVLHCFTGSMELLEVGLERDCYVSFSGIATFPKFDAGDRVRAVPEDRLLAETDAPYLAPVPKRGRRNEPAYVAHTVAHLAGLRDVPVDLLADVTFRNASAFYGLGPDAPVLEGSAP